MKTYTLFRKCLLGISFLFGSAASLIAQSHLLQNPTVELVKSGYQFLEGPIWVDSLGLLFSDIPANTVYRYNPINDSVTVFLRPSGNSNGLLLDLEGNLLLAQHGKRRVARINDGVESSVATFYKGDSLNSPNDLAIRENGSIFFTDPPYGISAGESELGYNGIFRVSPQGNVTLLDSTVALPNGILFSPDESKLYVNNTQEQVMYVWDVVNDSLLANKRAFVTLKRGTGGLDGMAIDSAGILYTTGPRGIWVVSPTGTVLDSIAVPGQNTNCTFGDLDKKTLYVTAGGSLYKIRSGITTSLDDQSVSSSVGMRKIYPNPVQSRTTIPVVLTSTTKIRLEIRSLQGQLVTVLTDQVMAAGDHSFVWEPGSLPSGMYLVHMLTENGSSTQTCMVRGE